MRSFGAVFGRSAWRVRRLLFFGCVFLGAVVAGCLCALLAAPGWYAPPVIPPAERQQVRNNLVAAEQAFTEGLRGGYGPFVYRLLQDDVNRWITMRREIYPLIDELAPSQLADPFVLFSDGKITIAGRHGAGLLDVLLSVDIKPTIEDDALVLRATRVRCGSARIPLAWAGSHLGVPVNREPEQTWPGSPRIWGDLRHGLRLERRAWWKNGGIAYRVLSVQVEPGALCLEIEPLGRYRSTANKTHD